MDTGDGISPAKRPYIRLTSFLSDLNKNAGEEVRFKCEAAGSPMPLQFSWLKNHAPIEKNRKIRVKNREYWSRLIITDLEVLDSGYYQCVVSNTAASVNTTAILRVSNVPGSSSSSVSQKITNKLKTKPQTSRIEKLRKNEEDYIDQQVERAGPSMPAASEGDEFGRLPGDEDHDDLWRVPSNAAGPDFMALPSTDRWLDGMTMRVGDCLPYRGEACGQYLAGRHIMVVSDSREDMYDIDRNLRAAMMFINNSPQISAQCKHYSHAVACYHMYKICDRSGDEPHRTATGMPQILTICRKDCDSLQAELCPNELALAAEHDLVGDDPKALLPKCQSLNPKAESCIPVISAPGQAKNDIPSKESKESAPHWCYVDSGKSYEGNIATTKSGKRCLSWSQSTSREFNTDRYPALKHSKNYCRNPGGKRTGPWCYNYPNGQEEYCDIKQCPPNVYSNGRDRELMGGTNDQDSVLNDFSELWSNLSTKWQLAVLGGLGFLLLSIILFCCFCCFRRKKKGSSTSSSSVKKNGGLHSCNGSVVNSGVNSAYYRKLNGTGVNNSNNIGFELSSLLPNASTTASSFIPQHHQAGSYAQYSPQPSTEPPLEPYQISEIQASQLQIGELIGEGQFAVIHGGNWHGSLISGEPMQVVIKSLKPNASVVDRQNFEEEIRSVAPFDHPNIVRLLGVCYFHSQQLSAVFEYMVHGDLHDFLRLRAPKNIGFDQAMDQERIVADSEDFLRIAMQIAYGMEYLASMNFVHRDLAARNCLVGDQRIIKIADFGLIRSCYENDYHKMMHRTWMPVRWMPREAIQYGRYSEASDVWSFGVVLWEIYSYGRQPYEGYTHQEVVELVSVRSLLDCPSNCPTNIYSLMVECWHEHPERRPTFSELYSRLHTWSLTSPSQSVLSHQPPNHTNSSHSTAAPHMGSTYGRSSSKTHGNNQPDVSPLVRHRGTNYYSDDEDDEAGTDESD